MGFLVALDKVDERKDGVKNLAQENSRVTRESLIWQQVHNSLETGGFSKVVDIVTQFKGTICTDHVGRNLLMFYYNNGSIGFSRFHFELSKQRA